MNKLVKILEAIGQSQSLHQNNNILKTLSANELSQLETVSSELYCIHAPGDDDD